MEMLWARPDEQAHDVKSTLALDQSAGVYGKTIPISCGQRKITGVPIWCSEFTRTVVSGPDAHIRSSGVGASVTDTRVSFAVSFGYSLTPAEDRLGVGVVRLWAEGKLIYDATNSLATNKYAGINFTLHNGDPLQTVDADVFHDKGDLAPAFRNMIYIVFHDFPQGQFMGDTVQLPAITAELVDALTISSEFNPFELIDDTAPIIVNGTFVDWDRGLFYGLSGTDTTDPVLHEFDIASLTEVRRVPIGPVLINIVSSANFVLYDPELRIFVVTEGGISNSEAVLAISADTGAIVDRFGTTSGTTTPSDATHMQHSYNACRVEGGEGLERKLGFLFGTSGNELATLTFQDGEFSFGERYVTPDEVTCLTEYPIMDRIDLPPFGSVPGGGQDWIAFAGINEKLYQVHGGWRSGVNKILSFIEFKAYAGYVVRGIHVDRSTYGLIIFLQSNDTTTWKAVRQHVIVADAFESGIGLTYLSNRGLFVFPHGPRDLVGL